MRVTFGIRTAYTNRVFDLHNDFPTLLNGGEYAKYLSDNAEHSVVAVIFTSELGASAEKRVAEIKDRLTAINPAQPIAIEDLGFLSDKTAAEMDFSDYFYCSLTWNHDNRFAGGALGSGRLTDCGKRLIESMNGRCAVDLAHLNRASFYDVLELSERPICSHTGFNAHPRSLDDAQVRALIGRRGIIGLCAVTAFTSAKTVGELAAVVDAFVQKHGVDHLCIGTDFCGTRDLPIGFKSYGDVDNFASALKRLGYADSDISGIFYDNAKRFYEEIQYARQRNL